MRPQAIVAGVVFIRLCGAPASAQDIPQLDPLEICRDQADAVGQGDWLIKACLDQEQHAYNTLNAQWPAIDAKTRAVCTMQADVVQQGYWLIAACISQEIEAKTAVDKFEFKR